MAKNISIKSGGSLKINLDKLFAIQNGLEKKYVTKVGILGQKAANRKVTVKTASGHNRAGSEPSSKTNAEIGLIQEKGSVSLHIPRRSFLMMPLEMKLGKYVHFIGESVMEGITADNIKNAYAKMGIVAEGIIQRAFASRGFGRWADNSPVTIEKKGSDSPLIDTAQLRKSITSTVVST